MREYKDRKSQKTIKFTDSNGNKTTYKLTANDDKDIVTISV